MRWNTNSGEVRATFLVEGFVRGTWRIEKSRSASTLVIEPFEPLSKEVSDALAEEGKRLVRFVEDGAKVHNVWFEEGRP